MRKIVSNCVRPSRSFPEVSISISPRPGSQLRRRTADWTIPVLRPGEKLQLMGLPDDALLEIAGFADAFSFAKMRRLNKSSAALFRDLENMPRHSREYLMHRLNLDLSFAVVMAVKNYAERLEYAAAAPAFFAVFLLPIAADTKFRSFENRLKVRLKKEFNLEVPWTWREDHYDPLFSQTYAHYHRYSEKGVLLAGLQLFVQPGLKFIHSICMPHSRYNPAQSKKTKDWRAYRDLIAYSSRNGENNLHIDRHRSTLRTAARWFNPDFGRSRAERLCHLSFYALRVGFSLSMAYCFYHTFSDQAERGLGLEGGVFKREWVRNDTVFLPTYHSADDALSFLTNKTANYAKNSQAGRLAFSLAFGFAMPVLLEIRSLGGKAVQGAITVGSGAHSAFNRLFDCFGRNNRVHRAKNM